MKILYTLLILLMTSTCYSADGDITQAEIVPDVVGWKLSKVMFNAEEKVCVVTYKKVDSEGKFVGKPKKIFFADIEDDPFTDNEDETSTDFTDLINFINGRSNINQSIKLAVQNKLGQ